MGFGGGLGPPSRMAWEPSFESSNDQASPLFSRLPSFESSDEQADTGRGIARRPRMGFGGESSSVSSDELMADYIDYRLRPDAEEFVPRSPISYGMSAPKLSITQEISCPGGLNADALPFVPRDQCRPSVGIRTRL